jgi:type VI secretion system ImpM family protein
VFSWMARAKESPPVVLGFGKIPSLAEFVRAGPKSPQAAAFEDWVVSAVEWSAGRRGDRWKTLQESAPLQSFVCRCAGDNGGVIAGVMRPSRDAVGRRFPLLIAALVPGSALSSAPHLTPLALEEFFARARSLLATVAGSRSASELQDSILRLSPPDLSRLDALAADYQSWADHALAWDVFEQAFGEMPIDRAEHALHTIVDATAPFRGQEAPPTALSVRVPLAGDSPQHVSFWLDVICRASGWKQTVPGWFSGAGAQGWSVLAQLGDRPHASLLADVWIPDAGSDQVCDLVAHPSAASFLTPLPTGLADAIADPESSMADLLRQLA